MIISTGIDIIEISRIEKNAKNQRFLKKLFTEIEMQYLGSKNIESTAGYFCAKEAVAKALGTGFSGFLFTDIEIVKKDKAPYVVLHGNAKKIAFEKQIECIHISISHCNEYATAIALAEGSERAEKLNLNYKIQKNMYPLSIIKKRSSDSHKGDYGKLFIVGGNKNMSGAIILATKASLRSGVGLVTCVIPECILDRVGNQVIEATYLACPELEGFIELSEKDLDLIQTRADVVAFGVGLGKTKGLKENLKYLLKTNIKPMVIDADGINMLADIKSDLKNHNGDIVLTPHTGEMANLIGRDIAFVNENRLEVAKKFAFEYNCILLLKGSNTIVTNGTRVYVNETGNPGMATGGSGDVLTGVIASLLSQGYETFDAAALGACVHGMAGDMAYEKYGNGLIAGDIIDFLGICLKG